MDKFNAVCKGYKDCIEEENSKVLEHFGDMGFRKVKIVDSITKVSCYIYVRSTVEVLRNQIGGACAKSCFFDPPAVTDEGYCHPMMADFGKIGFHIISSEIMSHSGMIQVTLLCHRSVVWFKFILINRKHLTRSPPSNFIHCT